MSNMTAGKTSSETWNLSVMFLKYVCVQVKLKVDKSRIFFCMACSPQNATDFSSILLSYNYWNRKKTKKKNIIYIVKTWRICDMIICYYDYTIFCFLIVDLFLF